MNAGRRLVAACALDAGVGTSCIDPQSSALGREIIGGFGAKLLRL